METVANATVSVLRMYMATTDPKKYRGKTISNFPYDQSRYRPAILLLPIVQDGEIIGYLPAKAIDNADGTATLTVSGGGGGGGGADPVGLKTTAGVAINPATEDTLTTLATETTLKAGVAEHHNGDAITSSVSVVFSATSKSLLIENADEIGDLLVSFDGGTNTKTIKPGQSLSIDANHASVKVLSSSGTVKYEMLVTV